MKASALSGTSALMLPSGSVFGYATSFPSSGRRTSASVPVALYDRMTEAFLYSRLSAMRSEI